MIVHKRKWWKFIVKLHSKGWHFHVVEPVTSLPELNWPTKNQSAFSSTVQHSDPDVDILHSLWFVAIESVGFDSQQISHRIARHCAMYTQHIISNDNWKWKWIHELGRRFVRLAQLKTRCLIGYTCSCFHASTSSFHHVFIVYWFVFLRHLLIGF